MIRPKQIQRGTTALLTIFLLILSACGTGETNVASGNRDGIIHIGNASEPQGLDPHVVTTNEGTRILQTILEGLVIQNPWTLEPEPGAAASWTISEDGKTYTFKLQPEGKWSNGEPVTASDYVWSWNRALHPKTGNRNAYLLFPVLNAEEFLKGEIADFSQVGIAALDDLTLQIKLKAPTPHLLTLLNHPSTFALHPETLLSFGAMTARYTPWTRPDNFVGNGAFSLDDWKMNRFIKVSRSDTYWDREKVKLNGIVFHPVDDGNVEERMFRVGQLHKTYSLPIDKVPEYRDIPDTPFYFGPYIGSYMYLVNTEKPPVDDLKVRKALAMTIDREQLARSIMHGSVTPSYAFVPRGIPGYEPPNKVDFDPEGARALLAESKYADNWPGLEIIYNTDEAHRKIAVAIQQMWKKHLGVEVTLTNQEWKVYADALKQQQYQVARMGWIGSLYPASFLDMFLGDSGQNDTGFRNQRYDDLILRETANAVTRDQRYELMYEAETILMENLPLLPIYWYSNRYLQHPSVKGMPENVVQYTNFKYVSLDPTEQLPEGLR